MAIVSNTADSEVFKIKKWALFASCVLALFISVTMTSLTSKLVPKPVTTEKHEFVESDNGWTKNDEETTEGPWIPIYYIAGVLSIVYYLIGLAAAYTEHYYLNITFAVLTTLSTILNILTVIDTPAYWASVVINIVVCVLSYIFTYDLRLRRLQPSTQTAYTEAPVKVAPEQEHINAEPEKDEVDE